MKAQEGKASLAYWLMPAEPTRSFFVSTIRELAARFGAPVFEPHLTIYVTSNNNDNPSDVLNRVLRNITVPCIGIRDLRYSDIFTKSLFVQFESNPVISRLNHELQDASLVQNGYQLDPHLSLMYKKMSPSAKIDIINSIRIPFTEVLFDWAQAVICPVPTESPQDVARWHVAARKRLT